MLLALLGLVALQAFWIYESVEEHNQSWKAKSKAVEASLKLDMEDDYFCFMLSRITSINLNDSLVVLNSSGKENDTLGAFQYVSEDTSLTYPNDVFTYNVPMWVQLELRFDYLLDSLSKEQLEADTSLLGMLNEYRQDAIIDSINGVRVGYRNSMERIIRKNLASIDWQEDIGYAVVQQASGRSVYEVGAIENEKLLIEALLYDNHQRFAEPYILKIYSASPWMSALVALTPLLIASFLIIVIAIILFLLGMKSWRKERMLSKLRKDMMHSLSHEMNTPISNMSLAIQSLQKKDGADKTYLRILQDENLRLAENVSRMMDYAQMEDNDVPLELERLELNALMNKVLDSFKSASKARIDFFESKTELWTYGDEKHLINVFYNLLGNALKYADQEPRIEVHSDQKGNEIILNFMDNNHPIPHDARHKIFEKYYRANGNSHDATDGYGLGLFYVRKVIRQHGGKVALSPSYFGGNNFELRIPISLMPV